MVGTPSVSVVDHSNSGWTKDTICMKWMKHFAFTVKTSNEKKVFWCQLLFYAVPQRPLQNYIIFFCYLFFSIQFLKIFMYHYRLYFFKKWIQIKCWEKVGTVFICPGDLSTLPRVRGKVVFFTDLKKDKIFRKSLKLG